MRWLPEETKALESMKAILGDDLRSRPQNAVSSDRRLLRFLKRYSLDPHLSAQSYMEHLAWRKDNGVDKIHDAIVLDNLGPLTMPHGKEVIDLMPQIPCSFEYVDVYGNPVSIEYYGFSPENILRFSTDHYLEFFIHICEYKMLILDHFSTVAERKAIAAARARGEPLLPGWGSRAIRRLTVVRCLKGFQLTSSISPRIGFVKDLLKMSQANYPYLTDNSFFVNTPWMFTIVWSVLKTALSSHTQTKIHILNSNYYDALSHHISPENLPPDLRKPGYETPFPPAPKPGVLETKPLTSISKTASVTAPAPPVHGPVTSVAKKGAATKKSRSFMLKSAPKKQVGKHGCAVVALSDFEFAPSTSSTSSSAVGAESILAQSANKESCRVTINSNPSSVLTATKEVSQHAASEDSQDVMLPVTTETCFVVSLGRESVCNSILALHFVIERSSSFHGTADPLLLQSTLEVLVDSRVAVDRLLCWVSFFDARGRSVARLKASVSYQPPPSTKQRGALSFSMFKSKKQMDDVESAIEPKQLDPRWATLAPLDLVGASQPRGGMGYSANGEEGGGGEASRHDEGDGPTEDKLLNHFESSEDGHSASDGDGVFNPPDFSEEFISSFLGTFFVGVDGIGDAAALRPQTGAEEDRPTDGGREVALSDTSSEWAVWSTKYFEVKKYAFDEGEESARAAFNAWSYVRIVTRHNREVAHIGTIFAPTLGLIREAIDVNCSMANGSIAASSELQNDQSNQNSDEMVYRVYKSTPLSGGVEQDWALVDEACDWAVWTDEMFEVRRYGFGSESQARAALENWYSVRLLTYREVEVTARSRWHTDALLNIREAIAVNKGTA